METLFQLGVFLVLLALGFFVGRWNEAKHYASIRDRERRLAHLPVIASHDWEKDRPTREAWLETACVVISIDYFKRIALGLRNLFGGEARSIEPLLDRARREALLRLKESAVARGADILVNLRLETSSIYGNKGNQQSIGSVELFAYATAIRYDGPEPRNPL
ncbi:MAG TPA: heavy metal-binding domain-containing protein [Candidatus Hydrogenedentes bacterium]|nr:heavy metal-binding domain-containing protein [Candidatus Hydrogenedentota bacterium]HOJ68874.1 heavy metal-binding domain-containing protein [Candidatus Hydrogenedentota bacterium]HOK89062.1 heavy metal-binding domain-containing protein [Candidatus Hydrogenedentota bacterium]HPO29967.1 heavy metal-binding domain-containing protein [Candidatus Hydrogenedentota bacterium]